MKTKGHLQDFIRWKYKQKDVKLSKLKFQFIKDFEYYLRAEKEMQQNTINKALQRFKKMINFAVAHDYLDKNHFLIRRPKPAKKEVVYLTKDELSLLQNKDLGNKRLKEVRDCFVFCCYTGLAFKEMSNFRKKHIVKGEDGKNWIRLKRQKTAKALSVPVLPVPQKIIDKYKGIVIEGKVLPSKTNAHFNAYLKEIAGICELNINLTQTDCRLAYCQMLICNTLLIIKEFGMEIGNLNSQNKSELFSVCSNCRCRGAEISGS